MFKTPAFAAAALVGPAAMAALVAVPAPASASTWDAAPSAKVYFTDLDLATDAGHKELEHRLIKAAREVCQMDHGGVEAHLPSKSSIACFREATSKVDGQIAEATRAQSRALRYGG